MFMVPYGLMCEVNVEQSCEHQPLLSVGIQDPYGPPQSVCTTLASFAAATALALVLCHHLAACVRAGRDRDHQVDTPSEPRGARPAAEAADVQP